MNFILNFLFIHNNYLFSEIALAKKLKELSDLEADIDNGLFDLIENRFNVTKKSKDLLENQLNDHLNVLVSYMF